MPGSGIGRYQYNELSFPGGAIRRGPGKDCRNFLAGLVMLAGLELWAEGGALTV